MQIKALKPILTSLFLCLLNFPVNATEVPRIINFTKQQYKAHNQNWSLVQGEDQSIYVGNSKGLLVFDGIHWSNLSLPGNEIVRAVTTDSQGRVFTGGYTSIGYWEKNIWGNWEYTSIKEKIENFGQEEIWHFIPTKDGVLFQSFARMYHFDGEDVKQVSLPGNIMFAQKVDDRIFIPVIESGLFEYFPDGSTQLIPGSEIFSKYRIATMLPGPDGSWLIGTQKNGVFQYKEGQFIIWNSGINDLLKQFKLNKGIRLHNGDYAFGTIVSGVLVTDSLGIIKHHINWEVGLQNNTILALMEDEDQQLWVGMDVGIDLIEINAPLRFFQGNRSGVGAVYSAVLFEENLYIGTNQGVFFKPWPSQRGKHFKLLEKSQGQVWDLQAFDGQLIGAHNNGAFRIQNNQLEFLSGQTGSYTTVAPPDRDDILLQGTYTGILVLRKNKAGSWYYSNPIENFPIASRYMVFDASGKLWVGHSHRGVFCLQLDSTFTKVEEEISFTQKQDLSFSSKSSLIQKNGRIILKSEEGILVFDELEEKFRPIVQEDNLPFQPGNYKIITKDTSSWFQVFPDSVVWHSRHRSQKYRISLFPKHEQIVSLSDSIYLFCLDYGYALLNINAPLNGRMKTSAEPQIVRVEVNDKSREYYLKKRPPNLLGQQLRFIYATPYFRQQLPMSYRLVGFNQEWSEFDYQYSREYTNLPSGRYEFQVRSKGTNEIAAFEFVVLPKWYETWWAQLLLILSLAGLVILLLRWHRYRLLRQERKLWIEKERELQRQRMQASNDQLRIEIDNKSKQLADSTMNLVRKNEMLTKIKKELVHYKVHDENKNPTFFISKLIKLVDRHLKSEEDWIQFEESFNQLHDNFFKRLKQTYPDLTPGDLKLAAYLKMNLSSKEIAPLLNISLRGIENKRYRLRKKMNLGQDENLTEILIHF